MNKRNSPLSSWSGALGAALLNFVLAGRAIQAGENFYGSTTDAVGTQIGGGS